MISDYYSLPVIRKFIPFFLKFVYEYCTVYVLFPRLKVLITNLCMFKIYIYHMLVE